MKIIGLAGTLAAGKDTVSQLLADKYHFLHVSTSDMLRAEKKRVFGNSPEAFLGRNDTFTNELRAKRGSGILIDLSHEEYERNKDKYPGGLVASGIRAIGEVEKIKELGGILVFVDADPKIRYGRLASRKRDANDHGVSFEEFNAMEQSESPKDPNDKVVQNLPAMKRMADIVIVNNGNDIAAFNQQVEAALRPFLTG